MSGRQALVGEPFWAFPPKTSATFTWVAFFMSAEPVLKPSMLRGKAMSYAKVQGRWRDQNAKYRHSRLQ